MSLLIGAGVCFWLSAFLSTAEMAFLSTDRVKLRDAAEHGNAKAKSVLELFSDSRVFLTTILIGNNVVNILATVLVTAFLEIRFGIHNEWMVTALVAPFLIVFCEIVPKGYGRNRAMGFLIDQAPLLLFLARLLYGPTQILLAASEILPGGRRGAERKNIFVNEDEFRFLIEESVRSGVLEEHEKKLVERILDFERIPVARVLVPSALVPEVELSQKVKDAKEKARQSGSKIILVYEEIPSIVIGMIYVFDLLFEENEDKGLREFLRSPIFLPKETSLEHAFLTLQEKRQSFALVTDARREVMGVVDIESLLAF